MKPDWGGASWVMEARTEAGQTGGHQDLSERYPLAAGLSLVETETSLERESSGRGAEAQECRGLGRSHTAPCLS